jgi:membrane-associated protease RseP (regulator of RpoE activity)
MRSRKVNKIYVEDIINEINQSIDYKDKYIIDFVERHSTRKKSNFFKAMRDENVVFSSPTNRQYIISAILFFLTFLSTTFSQISIYKEKDLYSIFISGLYFSIPLMGILLLHELGHFFVARYYKVYTSPPYFIPFPFLSIIGTLGAIIIMKDKVKNRKALIDIGFAGPIMSFLVSIPFFIIGLVLSEVVQLSSHQTLVYNKTYIVFGDSLLTYLLSNIFLPYVGNNHIIEVHPFALAGWVGLFITGLNLIPVGQLDGGHISYALFGRRYNIISILFSFIFIVMGFFWIGWFIWGFLMLFVLKPVHPYVVFREKLDIKHKIVGVLAWIIFLLTFVPVPIKIKTFLIQ